MTGVVGRVHADRARPQRRHPGPAGERRQRPDRACPRPVAGPQHHLETGRTGARPDHGPEVQPGVGAAQVERLVQREPGPGAGPGPREGQVAWEPGAGVRRVHRGGRGRGRCPVRLAEELAVAAGRDRAAGGEVAERQAGAAGSAGPRGGGAVAQPDGVAAAAEGVGPGQRRAGVGDGDGVSGVEPLQRSRGVVAEEGVDAGGHERAGGPALLRGGQPGGRGLAAHRVGAVEPVVEARGRGDPGRPLGVEEVVVGAPEQDAAAQRRVVVGLGLGRVDVALSLEVAHVAVAVGKQHLGRQVRRGLPAEVRRCEEDLAGQVVRRVADVAVDGGLVDALAAAAVPDEDDPARVEAAAPAPVAGVGRPARQQVEVVLDQDAPGPGPAVERSAVLGVDRVRRDADRRVALAGQHPLEVLVAEVARHRLRPARAGPPAGVAGAVAVVVPAVEEEHERGVGHADRQHRVAEHLHRRAELPPRQVGGGVVEGPNGVRPHPAGVGRRCGAALGPGRDRRPGERPGRHVEPPQAQPHLHPAGAHPAESRDGQGQRAAVAAEPRVAEQPGAEAELRAPVGDRQPGRRPPDQHPAGRSLADPGPAAGVGAARGSRPTGGRRRRGRRDQQAGHHEAGRDPQGQPPSYSCHAGPPVLRRGRHGPGPDGTRHRGERPGR